MILQQGAPVSAGRLQVADLVQVAPLRLARRRQPLLQGRLLCVRLLELPAVR